MAMLVSEVIDHVGQVALLDRESIMQSILSAADRVASGLTAEMVAGLVDQVIDQMNDLTSPAPSSLVGDSKPTENDLHMIMQRLLTNAGYSKVAQAFVESLRVRPTSRVEVVQPKLTENALTILEKRYLRKDAGGKPIETPAELFRRVAHNIASADRIYGATDQEVQKTEDAFYGVMADLEFLPNSPTLRGAGRRMQQLAGCFVLPIADSLKGIFDALKAAALIHQTGGGVGYAFSNLRPRGDVVGSTGNVAGGPISFMKVFNAAAQEITQGGVRMGANMGILSVHHPDILEFANSKVDGKSLTNFNISAAATDTFMDAVKKDEEYDLINPRTKQVTKRVRALDVFNAIVGNAWRCGDPGLIFIDTINRNHPTPHLGQIESTNPCGEQPLLGYEACNLGSINLSKVVEHGQINWERLRSVVRTAVHFLDNVIDMNRYPLPEIEQMTRGNRKIGLGVMGFSDMLVQLGVPYNSNEALDIADKVMGCIEDEATRKSVELAEKRGVFPHFTGSIYDTQGGPRVRNACRTTIAPTGTIGVLADASGGIEPIFAIVHKRETLFNKDGATATLLVVDKNFERVAKERGFYSEELMAEIAERGSIQDIHELPEDVKRLFVTSHDISPEWHVRMQAAFQTHIDAAVSKTVNFPHDATIDDVRKAYLLAHELGCKGITIYRDGSRERQVLNIGTKKDQGNTFEGIPSVKPRPRQVHGSTYRIQTPLGAAFTTINRNGDNEPFEVFVNVGKAGSDTAAVSEAIGRLISLALRIPSPLSPTDRLQEVADQLSGIGGGRPMGFGMQRVRSLPDGIAQALGEDLGQPHAQHHSEQNNVEQLQLFQVGDLCPECGQATFVAEEGCRKCYSCGHSEC